jgi:hypothetical protein
MVKVTITLMIDVIELKKQIDAINSAPLDIDIKEGVHSLLGTILDKALED